MKCKDCRSRNQKTPDWRIASCYRWVAGSRKYANFHVVIVHLESTQTFLVTQHRFKFIQES